MLSARGKNRVLAAGLATFVGSVYVYTIRAMSKVSGGYEME